MKNKRLAFVYPGQGSQVVGMGREIAERIPEFQASFRSAADLVGIPDLSRIMFEGPEEDLKRTDRTQPALFLVSAALHDILGERGVKPVIVAGHSVGEYAALYAAGVLDLESALRLVGTRGKLMYEAGQGAAGAGAMAAVLGLDDPTIEQVLAETDGKVVVANYNGPGQTVISGEKAAVESAAEKLKAAGAKRVMPLPVSGAFHSPMVKEAADQLNEVLNGITFVDPLVPVISNVDGLPHQSAEQLKSNLRSQMTSSVRWTDTVKALITYGVDGIVEVGPGSVLAGIIKRIDKQIPTYNVAGLDDIEKLLAS